jgi:hypothetical protein
MDQSAALLSQLKNALKRPPKIVTAYLDAGCVPVVSGGGRTEVMAGAPAGGTTRGWWSNGVYLMHKDQAVACRPVGSRTRRVLKESASLFEGCGLVKGLAVEPVTSLD